MGRPPTAAPASPSPYPPPTQQEAQTISSPPPPAQLYPPPPPPPQPQPPQPPEQYPPPNANVPMPPSPQKPPVVLSPLPQVNVVAGVPATMPPANIPVAYPPPSPLPQAVPTTVPSTNVPVAYPPPSPLPQAAACGVNTAAMNGGNMGMNGSNFGTSGGNVMSNNGAKAFFGTGTWTTGLFDCLDDPSNAIVTSLFPCITFGQIAEVLDEGHSTCGTSGTIYLCTFCHSSRRYRQKLRMKYGLIEAPISDKMAHCLFEWCALCQEYRELANRGLHPALGWQGNMNAGLQTQDNQFAMVPPMNQVMS